jgi:hypothetical protein
MPKRYSLADLITGSLRTKLRCRQARWCRSFGHPRFLRFGRVANHQRKPKDQTRTDERQALFELIEKRADSDFERELLAFAVSD